MLKGQVDLYYRNMIVNLKDVVPQVVDHFLIYEAGQHVRELFDMEYGRLCKPTEESNFMQLDPDIEGQRKEKQDHVDFLTKSIAEIKALQKSISK